MAGGGKRAAGSGHAGNRGRNSIDGFGFGALRKESTSVPVVQRDYSLSGGSSRAVLWGDRRLEGRMAGVWRKPTVAGSNSRRLCNAATLPRGGAARSSVAFWLPAPCRRLPLGALDGRFLPASCMERSIVVWGASAWMRPRYSLSDPWLNEIWSARRPVHDSAWSLYVALEPLPATYRPLLCGQGAGNPSTARPADLLEILMDCVVCGAGLPQLGAWCAMLRAGSGLGAGAGASAAVLVEPHLCEHREKTRTMLVNPVPIPVYEHELPHRTSFRSYGVLSCAGKAACGSPRPDASGLREPL